MAEVEKATTQVDKQRDGELEVEEKWVKYYSSSHELLLVGEGDFSFSTCLAQSFGSASNIVATSLDSYDYVVKKFKNAESNLSILDKLGASHLHEVDATKMKFHSNLRMHKFDRILFNFPHAGFHGKEDNRFLIEMHQRLLDGFFKNASGMLRPNGEIHVNHKTSSPYCHWNLEELASHNSLRLIKCVPFEKEDYPGYENKRGSGPKCDEKFLLGECCTFKFSFSPNAKVTRVKQNMKRPRNLAKAPNIVPGQPKPFMCRHPSSDLVTLMSDTLALNIPYLRPLIRASQQGSYPEHGKPPEVLQAPLCAYQQGNYLANRHHPSDINLHMSGIHGHAGSPHIDNIYLEGSRIFGPSFEHVAKALTSPDQNSSYFLKEALHLGYKRFIAVDPRRTQSDYTYILEQLRRCIVGRQAWQLS